MAVNEVPVAASFNTIVPAVAPAPVPKVKVWAPKLGLIFVPSMAAEAFTSAFTITPGAMAVALPEEVTSPARLAFVVTVPAVKPAAVPVILVPINADGVPNAGVTKVGEVANTAVPVPVSSDNAPDKFTEENEPNEAVLPTLVTIPVRFAFVVTVAALPPILKFVTGVVEVTTKGAVPVAIVEVNCVPEMVEVAATEAGVMAPRVKVMAGVVVAFATDPLTPLAVTTDAVVTVPVAEEVPAPIAVLKVAASRAETVLSAFKRGKVIAEGFTSVNIDCPIVVPPKDVRPVPAVNPVEPPSH